MAKALMPFFGIADENAESHLEACGCCFVHFGSEISGQVAWLAVIQVCHTLPVLGGVRLQILH